MTFDNALMILLILSLGVTLLAALTVIIMAVVVFVKIIRRLR